MNRLVAVVLVALATVGAGACGNDPSAPAASSARALASVIAQRDLGCADFTAVEGAKVADSGKCTVNGKQINLAVFDSEGARDRGTMEQFKGCIARRSFNSVSKDSFAFVRGPTWIIVSADKAVMGRVGKALHTDLETAPC